MFNLRTSFKSIYMYTHPLKKFWFGFSSDYSKIRNIGISAHIDSGKTTFSQRVLYYAGRIGSIHQVRGSDNVGATMDFMELQKQKGITIQSAATHLNWNNHNINLIDTPGHVDFTIQVQRALRVLDGGVLIICGVSGVQPQTLTVNKQMMRYNIPRVIFINKLDRMGANPFQAIDSVRKKLNLTCAAMQIPIGSDENIQGLVDLIHRKAYYFDGSNGEDIRQQQVPQRLVGLMQQKRLQLIGEISNLDEELQMMFLQQKQPSIELLQQKIRQLTIERKFIPVFMGSAYKNKGVQLCLNSVIKYLPSPTEKTNYGFIAQKDQNNKKVQTKIQLQINQKKPFVGYVFKLQQSRFGQLTYVRVYQGKVKKGDFVWNDSARTKLKISRMVKMHASQMQQITQAKAGDIFAIFGVQCSTGQTLTEGDTSNIIKCQSMFVPDSVMSLSINPTKKDASVKFQKALTKFQREDPTFKVSIDKQSQEIIISGMGELHLQIYVQRMKRQFNVDTIVGKPAVNYRQTITKKANFDYLHKKQTGGAGQYARVIGYVQLIQRQDQEDISCQFVSKISGTSIPPEYITACQKAFYQLVKKGPLTGYPVINVRYVLTDGATHIVDSSSNAFAIATKYAFAKALQSAAAQVLQPLMEVQVSCSKDVYSGVMAGLLKRKGSLTNTETVGDLYTLTADIPLNQMFGYATQIRGLTSGQGQFSMEYKKHTPMNPVQAKKAIEKYQKKRKDRG